MIKLVEETGQKMFGFTGGCASCATSKLTDDIKVIAITPSCGGSGVHITLCDKCREELRKVLEKENGAI